MRYYKTSPFMIAAAAIAILILILYLAFPGALSQEDNQLQLVSLILVTAYLLLGIGSKEWKSSDVMRAVMGWSFIALILLAGYAFRHEFMETASRLRGELLPHQALVLDEQTLEITKTNRNHFEVEAQVNGKSILFMVDTGATSVTLSPHDAKKIGIDVSTLLYNIPTHTANGRSWSASITLDHIQIGPILVKKVKAHVAKSGLNQSLLGMSFLSRLDSYTVLKDKMILKKES